MSRIFSLGHDSLPWGTLYVRELCTHLLLSEYRVLIQPFSQKSRTATVPKEFQIGLHDPAEADLEDFWNCCSVGFLGERL